MLLISCKLSFPYAVLYGLHDPLLLFTLKATHFRTGANEGNEGVAVGKERIFKRAKVERKSLMGDIAFGVRLDESIDVEGVERVNVTKDGESINDVA
ncbi:hypothetical protein RIF29_41657 [Crotalaria pallida]|uniref:Uncharacterized protein n=1 Tax=Crotalaria pallida TaxID=3830 RepID=A0AAN9EBK4_CROPI